MAHVRCRRTILPREVIRLRRKGGKAVGIAARVVKDIRSREENLLVIARVEKRNQLILIVKTCGFHQENRTGFAERKDAAARYKWIESSRKRRINVLRS